MDTNNLALADIWAEILPIYQKIYHRVDKDVLHDAIIHTVETFTPDIGAPVYAWFWVCYKGMKKRRRLYAAREMARMEFDVNIEEIVAPQSEKVDLLALAEYYAKRRAKRIQKQTVDMGPLFSSLEIKEDETRRCRNERGIAKETLG